MKEQQQGNQTEEGCGWQKQNEVQLEVHRPCPLVSFAVHCLSLWITPGCVAHQGDIGF